MLYIRTTLFACCLALAAGCGTTTTTTKAKQPVKVTKTKKAVKKARPHFPVVTWEQVAEEVKKGAVLVDSRSAKSYAKAHIPGAVNGPCRDQAKLKSVLPADKSRMLIFYCSGPMCAASAKSAAYAKSLGYTRLVEYRAGYPDWAKRQPAPKAAAPAPAAK